MNLRLAGLVAALIAVLVLGIAYYGEFWMQLVPCELCLLERLPYKAVLVLGLLAMLFGGLPARLLLTLAGLAMLVNIGISGLHVGVEFHWWASPLPECNGILTPGAALPMHPSVSCEQGVYLVSWLPLTMTQMDFIGSILFTILLFFTVSKPRRHR